MAKRNIHKNKTTSNKDEACAKCGACTAVCPVYQVTGRESLTARGRLHILKQVSSANPTQLLTEIFSKCLLCGACHAVCPRGINIPAQIISSRSNLPEITGSATFKKYLTRQALAHPPLLSTITTLAKSLKILPAHIPEESGLHLKFPHLTADLSSAKPLEVCLVNNASGQQTDQQKEHLAKALYFKGCLATYLIPEISQAASTLAKRLCHHSLIATQKQHCCGMAALAAGDKVQAQKLAKQNILTFSGGQKDTLPIFTSCATCFSHLHSYPDLFKEDPKWYKLAHSFAQRVQEFSTFLQSKSTAIPDQLPQSSRQDKVVYHDPCHLRFSQSDIFSVSELALAPRKLIGQFPGIVLQELPNGSQCCGQGGLFHVAHPKLSSSIATNMVDSFLQTDANQVVSTCSGCLLQWNQTLQKAKSKKSAIHLAILLFKQLKGALNY